MATLTQDLFTAKSDVVVSDDGWNLSFGTTVDALDGNDTLIGFGSGTFDGGDGNDKILFGAGT
jgi:hypothetical protein